MSRMPRRPRPQHLGVELDPADKQIRLEGFTEYIPIHELLIDESYQRDINWAFVGQIAEDFDPGQMGTLEIARRSCPAYTCEACGHRLDHRDYLIDGQHRALGARQRGMDDYQTGCHIRMSQGVEWEADQYLRLNFNRKNPSSTARYKAAVKAGSRYGWDNDAAVHELLDELGIETPTTTQGSFAAHRSQVGVLHAIGAVCRLHERHPDLVRLVLITLRDAWGSTYSQAFESNLIGGLTDFYCAHEHEASVEAVTRALSKAHPGELLDQVDQLRGNRKYPLRVFIARAVAEMYNASHRDPNRVREIAPVGYLNLVRARSQSKSERTAEALARARAAQAEFTPEQRSEIARRGAEARTPEERREIARRGVESMSPEERSERSRLGQITRREHADG
jgi:hypothetical protein